MRALLCRLQRIGTQPSIRCEADPRGTLWVGWMATAINGNSMILPATQRCLEWGDGQSNKPQTVREARTDNQPYFLHAEKLRFEDRDKALASQPTRAMDTQINSHTVPHRFRATHCMEGDCNIIQVSIQVLRASSKLHNSMGNSKIASINHHCLYRRRNRNRNSNSSHIVPQYQPRQSAALEALSSQLGVPPYFSPGGPTGTPVPAVLPQYLTPQVQPSSYSQGMVDRSSTAQSFPVAMAELNTTETTDRLGQQERSQEAASSDDAYSQYQQALRMAFDHTRAGRLVDASQSLLEISEWLVCNSRELGILRDDQELHAGRLKLWDEFNLCWLSLFQKQKDITQALLQSGERQAHPSMLTLDMLDKMGKELIRLCDKMEPHGLVDYQMGIWEEEILSVLGQCLDLLEGRSVAEQGRR
ncbi:hypothetical protein DTO166G5_460 [Paecilomyces variotii]|nr:hypothetical protein DTO166G5_460 [Paecilomyces variotii]KAJ9368736.1 hypothetical protein DTO282E5_6608 [Paecilomyces variotii]